jgi:hypothetical protein
MKTWDGTSPTRPDALVRKSPDGVDWKTITKELQELQIFVGNLAVNAEAMPDLVKEIKVKKRQLDSLSSELSSLTPPDDVIKRVDKIEETMEELRSVYVHAAEVLQTVSLLQRQLLNLNARIEDHIEDSKTKRIAFENKVVNWQRSNEARTEERLAKAEKMLGTISLALSLKKFGEE